jgi:hypothetical protein
MKCMNRKNPKYIRSKRPVLRVLICSNKLLKIRWVNKIQVKVRSLCPQPECKIMRKRKRKQLFLPLR